MGSIDTENSIASHLVSNSTRVFRVAANIVFTSMLIINEGRGFYNVYFSFYVKSKKAVSYDPAFPYQSHIGFGKYYRKCYSILDGD